MVFSGFLSLRARCESYTEKFFVFVKSCQVVCIAEPNIFEILLGKRDLKWSKGTTIRRQGHIQSKKEGQLNSKASQSGIYSISAKKHCHVTDFVQDPPLLLFNPW